MLPKHGHIRLQALLEHKTQIGDPEKFKERMKTRHTEDSTDENPRYEDKFRSYQIRTIKKIFSTNNLIQNGECHD